MLNVTHLVVNRWPSSWRNWQTFFLRLQERMYRLLTDILMSKTIQFALLEFLIFHIAGAESAQAEIKLSALFLHSYFMTYYIESYGGRLAREDGGIKISRNYWSDSYREQQKNSINISYFNLSKEWFERARRLVCSAFRMIIRFDLILRPLSCLFTHNNRGARAGSVRVVIENFYLILIYYIARVASVRQIRGKRDGADAGMDDSIKRFLEGEWNCCLTQLAEWIYGRADRFCSRVLRREAWPTGKNPKTFHP